ncbi:50S ribosomal protein L1 [Verrucomicrobiales bacterium]|nr:50S ribosomal protein L1 [Verrucomicrobiales bacterium]MDB4657449.1 50S ribosomal protein L1 [Verrucomicrobiales bacterium]MDB4662815.1 50S ribosomal protein L1 [Verrucomicrobiales bacterium]MDC0275656.1 50S ribosomal protein L1 [Verrucomicrobiales bacterium]MDC0321992.1 50S ribosomal protein L1 [Verrucomicrobiales bacterium]
MASKRSKRYEEAAKLVDPEKVYDLEEAIAIVKKFPAPKFDQTVTVTIRMGVDPKQSDQMVRGTCPLPHGSGKEVRVLVFAEGEAATQAKNAGAEHVGYEALLKEVQGGFMDFDVVIATPAAMSEVRKLGRQLGPSGLMPNPKTGTVTDDTEEAVKAVKAGRVDFRLDKNGNISVGIGKVSFEASQLEDNAKAIIEAINQVRPASAKGDYLRTCTLAATMSPGVSLELAGFRK